MPEKLNQYFVNPGKRQKRQRSPDDLRRQSLKALDRLNLSLGDVRDVFELYLSIYLAVNHHWSPAQIGIVISTTSVAGILAQTPAGALIDSLRQKRLLVAISTTAVALSYIVIVKSSALPVVIGAQATIGVGASLSNLVAGFVVKTAGYKAGFFTLAAIAAVAFGLFLLAMPETKEKQDEAT